MVIKLSLNKKIADWSKEYFYFLYRHFWLCAIIFAVCLVFTASYFQEYLTLPSVGAWDGDGHYAINKYFAEHIFPALSGWVPTNSAGLPWPVGYTPLLTYLLAIWSRLLPVNFMAAFKLFFIVLNLVFPLIVYFSVWKLTQRKVSAFLSALLSIYLMLMPISIVYLGGITMRATFAMGHYPQFLATCLFTFWIWTIFKTGRKWTLISSIALALVLLANLHTFQVCLVLLAIKWLFDLRRNWRSTIKQAVGTVGIVFLLCVFWLMPLIQNSRYFLTKTTGEVDASSAITALGVIGIGGFFIIFFELIRSRRRDYMAVLWISSAAIFLLSVLPLRAVLPGLPVQPDRLLPYSLFLIMLILPEAIYKLSSTWKNYYRVILFVIIVVAIGINLRPAKAVVDGNFKINTQIEEMVTYVKQLPHGRSIVEAWFDPIANVHDEAFQMGQPTHMVISGLLADGAEHETLWGVFRESSIGSPFIQPIRNSLSPDFNEAYGVVCWLCNNEPGLDIDYVNGFNQQPIDNSLKRAQVYGVNYILARSSRTKLALRTSSSAQLLRVFGDWEVFQLTNPTTLAETPADLPILTFTSLKNRDREFNSYDWLRLNEEWLYYVQLNHVLAYAHNQDLSTSNDFENFKLATIVEYKYSDLGKAFIKLRDYAIQNKLFLWESEDPLFIKLQELNNPNIKIVAKTGNVHFDFGNFLPLLPADDFKQPQKLTITKAAKDNHFQVSVPNASQIYLKYSYYPAWRADSDVDIYMASPAQLLLISHSSNGQINLSN